MSQTRYIHFRVTNEQFNMIKTNARIEGFKTVSNYLRDMAMNRNPEVRDKIKRIWEITSRTYELVKGNTDRRGR